jgi:group I intron endonuclease
LKYYIGSSKNINCGCRSRWNRHRKSLNRNDHRNTHLQSAWNKYGESNFGCIIIEKLPDNITKKELLIVEQKYLNIAKTEKDKCYNICFEADGSEWSEESREKLSNTMKGRKFTEVHKKRIGDAHRGKIVSKETKKKMSESKTGINHPMYGRHHSEETKQKMVENNKRAMLGKHFSLEIRLKMGKNRQGKNNGMFGKGYLMTGELHPLYNHSFYKFKNKITNEIFEGTQYDFIKKYKLIQSSVSRLMCGKYKSHKDWVLTNEE